MRLGITSYAYRYAARGIGGEPLSPAGTLQRTAEAGLQMVQFCENQPLWELELNELEELKQLSRELGVGVELGAHGLEAEHLHECIDLAAGMGSRALRIVVDTSRADQVEKIFRGLLPVCDDAGVILALENHGRLPLAEMAALLGRLDTPTVRACLDLLNSIERLEGPAEVLRHLAPFAAQLHLKDARTESLGTGWAVRGSPIGEGLVDLGAALDATVEQDPDVFLEQWMEPAEDASQTLAQEREWLERGIANVRRLLAERDLT
jgi:sugar phosphate isomerase/epimerase